MKYLIICSLFFLTFSSNLVAQDEESEFTYDKKSGSVIPKYLGKISLIKGSAFAKDLGGDERTLKKGDKIYKGETVRTIKASILKIEMVDMTIVTVGVNSALNFEKFKYKTKKDREAVINLLKGQVRTYFKVKSKKPEQLKVKVGQVSMGVRGTKILANYFKNSKGDQVTQVALIEGKARLYDKASDHEEYMGRGDHYVSILKNDGTSVKREKLALNAAALKRLDSKEVNEQTGFRPFLLDFNSNDLDQSEDGLDEDSDASKNGTRSGMSKKNKNWKETLKKLNSTLKKNHKN